MSTTIDRSVRFASAAAGVLLAWGAVLVVLPFLGSPGRQVAIVGDPRAVVPAVAMAGGQLIDVRGDVTLARSDHQGFVRALYRSGALLVVEGRASAGCLRS